MRISFVSQPYEDDVSLLEFFRQVAADDRLERVDIVVAWAKSAGVEDLRPSIEAIRARRGHVRAIVGISLGGTSRQALALIRGLVDEVYVFHQPGRTFHPKVYFASGTEAASVIVGSHNLTGGGVQTNFEAGIVAELDLRDEGDSELYRAVAQYVDRLLSDDEICIGLNDESLEELVRNRRYPLADEESTGDTEPVEGSSAENSYEEAADDPRLFGDSKFELRSRRTRTERDRSVISRPPRSSESARATPPTTNDPVARRWFKKLPAADAQHLTSSHPSGTMTLVQFGHPIDAGAYFREELFGDAGWVQAATRGRQQAREVATIECEVHVRGASLGSYTFEIRHTPGYESDQANRTTEFVWGEFAIYLRDNDLTDLYATIEKTASGRYRLVIAEEPTGGFLY